MQQIIIVEDDQIIREELQIFLSKYGYEIKAPTEFNNIVDYILKQNADLILLDINLPVLMAILYVGKLGKHLKYL